MTNVGNPLGQMIVEMNLNSSKFTNSLTAVKRTLKNVESEMKAQMAVFNTADDKIGKLEAQYKGLSKAMTANEKHIEQLTTAYKEEVKASGESSVKAQNLAKQINNAVSKQANYERQLKATAAALNTEKLGLAELNAKLEANERNTSALVKSQQLAGKSVTALRTQYTGLQQKIKDLTLVREAEREKLNQIASTQGKTSSAYVNQKARIQELDNQIVESNKTLEGYKKRLGSLPSGFDHVRDSIQKVSSNFKDIGQKMRDVGSNFSMKMTLPLTAGFGLISKSAISFNDQIQGMAALLDDGSVSSGQLKKQLDGLSKASMDWSTQYGVSTEAINNGMEEIIKKGYSYEQTLGAMPSILDASKASGEDFNTVMDNTTSILEQFGLKVNDTQGTLKNTQRVTDSLTFVANKTAAGFSDMGLAMEYVGPVAHSVGFSLEETASAIGLMSNNGIEGEKAGTALRGALTRLLKPSDANVAAFKRMGINIEDFKKGTITLPGLIDTIKKNTKGWTKESKAAAIATAFGTEAQTGMNILINQGGDALRGLTKETKNATGYTKGIANTMNETAAANVHKFFESVKVLGIQFGNVLLPVLAPLVKWLTKLSESFSKLPKNMKIVILAVAGIAAAIGPALMVLGSMFTGLGAAISILTNPITWVVAGVVALGAAFTIAYKKIQPFHDFIDGTIGLITGFSKKVFAVVNGIKDMFQGNWAEGASKLHNILPDDVIQKIIVGVTLIKNTVNGLAQGISDSINKYITPTYEKYIKPVIDKIVTSFQNGWNQVTAFFQQHGGKILEAIKNIFIAIGAIVAPIIANLYILFNGVIGAIGGMVNGIATVFSGLWTIVSNVFGGIIQIIEGVILVITGIFTGDWKTLWEGVKNIFSGIWQAIVGILSGVGETIWGIIKGVFGGIVGFFQGIWNGVVSIFNMFGVNINSIVSGIASGIVNFFKNAWNTLVSITTSVWNGISAFFVTIGTTIVNIFTIIFTPIIAFFQGVWNVISSIFRGAWYVIRAIVVAAVYGIKMVIMTVWNGIVSFFGPILNVIKNIIMSAWNAIKTATSVAFSIIKTVITTVWNAIKSVIMAVVIPLVNFVISKWNYLKAVTSAVFNVLKGVISSIWNAIKTVIINPVVSVFKSVTSWFGKLKNGVIEKFNGIKNKASEIWNAMIKTVKELPGKMGKGLADNAGKIANGAKAVANKLVGALAKGVNGVTGGINWILGKVKAPKKFKIPKWEPPKFAKGTNAHFGGPAIVNDAKGANFRELIRTPDGQTFIPKRRNVMLNLPKGSQVIPGDVTAKLMSVPRYKNGIWDGIKKTTSSIWGKTKEIAGTVWDYASNPKKLIELAVDKFTNLGSITQPILSIATGAISKVKDGAINWIKSLLSSGENAPSGSGVTRWAGQLKKALEMNGLPTTPNYVNAWLRQIKSESSGNEKATQHGYTDVNTLSGDLAKGLLQTISATFNAYKFKGHGNIYNGFDNMLAAIRYAKSRYGVQGMLGVIGHGHGYENGGLVTNHQIAEIAEGNKPEMIIPLTKKTRAVSLVQKAQSLLGMNDKDRTVDLNAVILQLIQSNKQQSKMIELLKALLSKELIVDKNALERSSTKIQSDQLESILYALGEYS